VVALPRAGERVSEKAKAAYAAMDELGVSCPLME
jgi:hypothetical protein